MQETIELVAPAAAHGSGSNRPTREARLSYTRHHIGARAANPAWRAAALTAARCDSCPRFAQRSPPRLGACAARSISGCLRHLRVWVRPAAWHVGEHDGAGVRGLGGEQLLHRRGGRRDMVGQPPRLPSRRATAVLHLKPNHIPSRTAWAEPYSCVHALRASAWLVCDGGGWAMRRAANSALRWRSGVAFGGAGMASAHY